MESRANASATVNTVGFLYLFQPFPGLIVLRKSPLFLFEFASVHKHATILDPSLVSQMKHLVIHHVFHDKRGNFRHVKDAADEDGVVCGIVATENVARPL